LRYQKEEVRLRFASPSFRKGLKSTKRRAPISCGARFRSKKRIHEVTGLIQLETLSLQSSKNTFCDVGPPVRIPFMKLELASRNAKRQSAKQGTEFRVFVVVFPS
jgi:hypothetical protein